MRGMTMGKEESRIEMKGEGGETEVSYNSHTIQT